MTKTQRTILFFLPVQALVIFLFFFLTRYWYFGLALQAGLTFFMIRRVLSGGNRPVVLAKSTQPVLFLFSASLYSMLLVQLYGVGIPFFVAQTIVVSLLYGLISLAVLRSHTPAWTISAIALAQVGLVINFAALSMAYWRVPGFIVLPFVFVVCTYIALWWLIEVDKPNAAAPVYASVFGLLATELLWVYSHWVLVYQLPRINVVLAQVAFVITALAYSLGGVYIHRSQRPKRKQMIAEYGIVFVIVFIVTFASTRWINGL